MYKTMLVSTKSREVLFMAESEINFAIRQGFKFYKGEEVASAIAQLDSVRINIKDKAHAYLLVYAYDEPVEVTLSEYKDEE